MRSLNRVVGPILSILAVLVTAGFLVTAIVFSEWGPQWAIFLTGVLVAATLSLASRASKSEWTIARRSAKISQLQDKLQQEQRARQRAETKSESSRLALDLIESVLPKMIFYVDRSGIVRLHNHSFRSWFRLPAEKINGRPLSETISSRNHEVLDISIKKAMLGEMVIAKHSFTNLEGKVGNFLVQLLPHLVATGSVAGLMVIATDAPAQIERKAVPPESGETTSPSQTKVESVTREQSLFLDTFSEQISGSNESVQRVIAAIEHDEFCLYYQQISPLAANAVTSPHYEIFVRLIAEEHGLMPPGEFFPLLEKHGMMPRLDRWVVKHAAQWAASSKSHNAKLSSLFINLAENTLCDSGFPAFVGEQVKKYHLPKGALCFEVTDAQLYALKDEVAHFIKEVRAHGCHVALSGFGRAGVSFRAQQGLQFDFLKIDGSIILSIMKNPMDAARVAAIAKVAKSIGAKTVAELVETDECILKLRELGVDFAQGLGISPPHPMDLLT